ISVFSHLNEANHLVWLEELHRVSSPDAVLILTVMGEHALGRLENETEFREWAGLRPQDLEFARTGLSKGGFAFVRQDEGHLDQSLYGVAFMKPDYVERHWSRWFEVLEYKAAAIENNQDAVVLRPRPSESVS
ncbi:MAG: hypothetical protein KDB53_07920, partial [Planctomycetes bacterium]|nr:hypothetical protein [Planctomycetota bacterium]